LHDFDARIIAELAVSKSHYINYAQTLSPAHGGPHPGSGYHSLSDLFMTTFERPREAWKMQIQTEMSCLLCKQSRPAKVKNATWFELSNFAWMVENRTT